MKKISILTLSLILGVTLLTGCGCTRTDSTSTSAPTVLPTNEEKWETTHETTSPTVPSTNATTPSTNATAPSTVETTRETIDHGNDPLEDPTTTATAENRARQNMIG